MLGKTAKELEPSWPERGPKGAEAGPLSVITKEMRIHGDCETSGRLRLQGRIEGNVTAKGIELLESGEVRGDVNAAANAERTEAFIIGGRVMGVVRAGHVEVKRSGIVQGGVEANEAVIHGHVHGGIRVSGRLALEATAQVEGDVFALRLSLVEGGQVNGTIRMGEHAPAPPSRAATKLARGAADTAEGSGAEFLAEAGSGGSL